MSALRQFLRPVLKRWYYSYWPGQAGSFPYFGTRVFFPPRAHLFERVCAEDIYEAANVRLLKSLVRPETCYFDVGANIGLMSVPLLCECLTARVVSFEPSPNAQPYLKQTHAGSPFNQRWQIISKAVGKSSGSLNFYCASAENSVFDGFGDTGRAGDRSVTSVSVTTLDAEWAALNRPKVSVIKIDVEGAELGVLEGAAECIRGNQPAILTEWNADNLRANGCAPEALLDWAKNAGYLAHSLPHAIPVTSVGQLNVQMLQTQDFLLLPTGRT